MSEGEVVKEGELSKDFTLKDHNGEEFTLSDFKGKKVLLSFHPLAGTSVCAKQMKSLEENKDRFEELNTVAVGISVDSVPAKKLWAEDIGVKKTRLLADFWPHGKVIKMYGLFREEDGFSERANVLIDEDQRVIFSKVYPMGEVPDLKEIFSKIKKR
ncbi:MAG: redoxin domain-containing protein [Candidatus Saliniplasma sp.]